MLEQITIDAAGKALGRVASAAAVALRGKHRTTFAQNIVPSVRVTIVNAGELRFTGTKLIVKQYHRFSGYPGGLKTTTLKQEFQKSPVELVRQSVRHMLPNNRLATKFMRHLTIHRGAVKPT